VYDEQTGQTTFVDDDADFVPGELVGKFLHHTAIVANTATTITVAGHWMWAGAGGSYQVEDYHLATGSPCIDAGDNTAVPGDITTDLDGNPRFVDDPDTVDTGYGDPPVVDMGAYEFQGMPCPRDLNGNGYVWIFDLVLLLFSWGPCDDPGDCPADFDGNGCVGVTDLLELLAAWGPCP
jgi:hypothetical protein